MNRVVSRSTVILFELLDYNAQLLLDKSHSLNPEGYYRIAWGYLRPLGNGGVNVGRQKIKLYRYKCNSHSASAPGPTNRSLVPDVYYDFRWPYKSTYRGYVQVQLVALNWPGSKQMVKHFTNIF